MENENDKKNFILGTVMHMGNSNDACRSIRNSRVTDYGAQAAQVWLHDLFRSKKASGAFSCGPFTVTPPYQSRGLLSHEAGHAIQNIMYGPLMPFIVSLPSVIRFYHRARIQKKNPQAQLSDYDSIWFEAQATKLGIRHFM